MKKRILSILLVFCIMMSLMPISVFAEGVGAEGSASVQLGTTALSKNVNTATAQANAMKLEEMQKMAAAEPKTEPEAKEE